MAESPSVTSGDDVEAGEINEHASVSAITLQHDRADTYMFVAYMFIAVCSYLSGPVTLEWILEIPLIRYHVSTDVVDFLAITKLSVYMALLDNVAKEHKTRNVA